MYHTVHVKLLNLLLSLSDALDLASPQISQHQLRTAYIAWEIGKACRLSTDDMASLFIAALLHDVGALTPEEKVDVWNGEVEILEQHCILGEKLLRKVPIFEIPCHIVRLHHSPYSGGLFSTVPPATAMNAQILLLGDTLERAIDRKRYILHQDRELIQYIKQLSGKTFRPDIVDTFLSISYREDFWLDLVSPRLYSILLNSGPCKNIEIELSQFLAISEMFRDMIDFRSRFTATHSSGVAAAASAISRSFGFTDTEVELMEVAGNLHDLGKMAIPNSILNKPGKLTDDEFAIMRQHTYYTYAILRTIGGINSIAEWAAFHHERLDGTGYPFHLKAESLTINSRIMAVADIFTALTEDRPYRKSLPRNEVLSALKGLAGRNWLDAKIVSLLESDYAAIEEFTKMRQANSQQLFETEFA